MRSKALVASISIVAVIALSFWLKGRKESPFGRNSGQSPQTLPTSTDSTQAPLSALTQLTNQAVGGEESPVVVTEEDIRKDELVGQILASRNDNDPRFDTELKNLTPGTRQLLRSRYQGLALEKRNERGTIVFLIGRSLDSETDLKFLADVVAEPPCRSLSDCNRDPNESTSPDDMHHEAGSEVTLAYPQLSALKMLERSLAEHPKDWPLRQRVIEQLRDAEKSPIPRVAALAREIGQRESSANP